MSCLLHCFLNGGRPAAPCGDRKFPGTVRRSGVCYALPVAALLVIALASPAAAQTWISAVSASTTSSNAIVTWTTAVPSDSQVEYGTTTSYGSVSLLAATKVIGHSVTLSGLTAGATYHFRVRSTDSSGVLVISPDYTLTLSVPVVVAVSPQSATLASSGTQQFTAAVSNTTNQAVSWSATGGSISSSGLYTAPAVTAATNIVVTATSAADSSKSATAQVAVQPPPPVAVTVSPASATVPAGGQQQFTALVSNTTNAQVSWSATAGSISAAGLYSAPVLATSTSATVTATSQADPTKTASALLQISAAPPSTPMLLGDQNLESVVNHFQAGTAEGFQMTASTGGSLSALSVYLDASCTATRIFLGLYSDSGGHPGTLLTSGSTAATPGAWNTAAVPQINLTSGSKYWFALLGSGGVVQFRQKQGAGGWIDELHAVRTLTSLPSTWTSGPVYAGGAWTSAYGSGTTSSSPVPSTQPPSSPVLAVTPTSLSFTAQTGSAVAASSVSISNSGTGTLSFTSSSDQSWLVVSPSSGTAPYPLQVAPVISALKAGSYTGHVTIAGGGSSKTVTVGLTLTAPPVQHAVALSWSPSKTGSVVGYNLYRSTVSGSSYGLLSSALSGTSYTDQTVQSGGVYYYVVTAVDDQGHESAYSGQASATVP